MNVDDAVAADSARRLEGLQPFLYDITEGESGIVQARSLEHAVELLDQHLRANGSTFRCEVYVWQFEPSADAGVLTYASERCRYVFTP